MRLYGPIEDVEGTVVVAPGDSSTQFHAWVTPFLPVMARVAARLAPTADRDDVLQEALTKAWRRRSTFDPSKGTPAAWLCAIVANTARHASHARRESPIAQLHHVPTADADGDLALDVVAAIAQLSKRQREAVDLHYYAGLSVAETATVMGCSAGTVKSTLSDARARLRDLLGDHA